jgi:hypothetical protein
MSPNAPPDPLRPHLEREESDPFARPWLSVLIGFAGVGYAWYWLEHPSTYGLNSGFGFVGRILAKTYEGGGKWPVAFFFALGGVSMLGIGFSGVWRRYGRPR